jgi:hypothetical protein
MEQPAQHRRRLLSEIVSVQVTCDDCGHSRVLTSRALRSVQDLGVHTYEDLCRKVRCGECPRQPLRYRSITMKPIWRAGFSQQAG